MTSAVMLKMISHKLDISTTFKLKSNTLHADNVDEISFTAVSITTTPSVIYNKNLSAVIIKTTVPYTLHSVQRDINSSPSVLYSKNLSAITMTT